MRATVTVRLVLERLAGFFLDQFGGIVETAAPYWPNRLPTFKLGFLAELLELDDELPLLLSPNTPPSTLPMLPLVT